MCEENKKLETLTDDQLEGVSGGGIFDGVAAGPSTIADPIKRLSDNISFSYLCPTCGYSKTVTVAHNDTPSQMKCPHCDILMMFTHN